MQEAESPTNGPLGLCLERSPMQVFAQFAFAAALVAVAAGVQAAPVTGQGTWENTLKARDINGNAVALNSASAAFFYDTTLDVTWLANMNQNGIMTRAAALTWAADLTTGGFDDWRLPSITPVNGTAHQTDFSNNASTDVGYAKTGTGWGTASEWGHLYYVTLGNLGLCTPNDASPSRCTEQAGWGLVNTAYFQNLVQDEYWSGTEFSPNRPSSFGFDTVFGRQGCCFGEREVLYAAAVRSGDVLRDIGTVPEPKSLTLSLTALTGLGLGFGLRRRRAA